MEGFRSSSPKIKSGNLKNQILLAYLHSFFSSVPFQRGINHDWLVILTILKNMSSSMGRIIPFLWNGKYNSCSKPPTRWYTSPTRLGKLGKSSNDPRFRLVERLQFFHQANSGTLDAGPLRAPPNSMAIGIWAVKTWHMWHMVYGHHGHPTECGLVPNGLMTIPQSGYIYI